MIDEARSRPGGVVDRLSQPAAILVARISESVPRPPASNATVAAATTEPSQCFAGAPPRLPSRQRSDGRKSRWYGPARLLRPRGPGVPDRSRSAGRRDARAWLRGTGDSRSRRRASARRGCAACGRAPSSGGVWGLESSFLGQKRQRTKDEGKKSKIGPRAPRLGGRAAPARPAVARLGAGDRNRVTCRPVRANAAPPAADPPRRAGTRKTTRSGSCRTAGTTRGRRPGTAVSWAAPGRTAPS